MCGIFALLNNDETIQHENINLSINAGKARGPEEYKYIQLNKVDFHFHRLAINGLDKTSAMQPFNKNKITIMCNGEIYNHKQLEQELKLSENELSGSDCEVLVYLYDKYGIEATLQMIDGVFGLIIYDERDENNIILHAARDPFGVRPLYASFNMDFLNGPQAFASEVKVLTALDLQNNYIIPVEPGTFFTMKLNKQPNIWYKETHNKYFSLRYSADVLYNKTIYPTMIDNYALRVVNSLENAVIKRVQNTDRPVACLLSGGLDSSLIAALVAKHYRGELHTYSIGMEGSVDCKMAKLVSQQIGSIHHEVILTEQQFFDAIPRVIEAIESYDTTTVRASVGNYLIAEYIRVTSNAKVIFNGDGSDEVTGGYIYVGKAPSDLEFDLECRRLLKNIHTFDVLRSDRSISSHGLEPRTPFLDKTFVDTYMSVPVCIRNHKSAFNKVNTYWKDISIDMIEKGHTYEASQLSKRCEKLFLRYAFHKYMPDLLPLEVLWRGKEAFSDGVSGNGSSWYEIISNKLENIEIYNNYSNENHNKPDTKEKQYYRQIFDNKYKSASETIPYFWMPKWVETNDPSARTISFYNK